VEPPAEWTIGAWQDRRSYYAGSPESLAGDLVREGVSGLAAQVAEPFLDGSVRPQVFLPAYLSGFTLAEAFYLATPYVGWRGLVLGDPLCRVLPRPGATGADAEPDADPDPQTGAGPFFARRWVEAAQAQAPRGSRFRLDAVRLALKAQSSLARADEAASRAALEQATELEPGLVSAQVALASLYEASGDDAKGEARYRAVLARNPNHVVALNNLAYLLGARQRRLDEGMNLARRAHTLAPGNPSVADTLGWLHFLAGDTAQAARYIGEALREGGDLIDVRIHAAAVALAAGQLEAAAAQLEAALALDDSVAGRDDVRELRARLDTLRR
jgi:Tfp pilus assembly protein PilF